MRDDEWVVITADEARMVWESESRRAWLKTGEKTILKVHRDDQYQSFFGGLNVETKKCHLFQLPWQNQEEIIKVLKKLVAYYPHKKICIIWDNARWHKGKILRNNLGEGRPLSGIHLVNLYPYAPDTNPQEKVWRWGKDQIANRVYPSLSSLTREFLRQVTGRSYPYQITEFDFG